MAFITNRPPPLAACGSRSSVHSTARRAIVNAYNRPASRTAGQHSDFEGDYTQLNMLTDDDRKRAAGV